MRTDSVVSVLFGKTGRNLMELLTKDKAQITWEEVESCVRGKLKSKCTKLLCAVQGFVEEHHRWLLREMLDRVDQLVRHIARIESRLKDLLEPYAELIDRMPQIPGIGPTSVNAILSETRTTLES